VKQNTSAADFGQTHTAADGFFAMAANGGSELVVRYTKAGYLEVQRKLTAPWQDYAILPDVVMIGVDTASTNITFGSATSQVHRASVVTDSNGTRQATVFFPSGTTATMVFPNGTGQSVGSLTVRATEFTRDPTGPLAMPQMLPPTSGYTYSVELNGDEAAQAGARRVEFNQPVMFYLENYLGFPTGLAVPQGSYDRAGGCWKPEQNGRVIEVLGVSNGSAVLDTDGDGQSDDATILTNLGISAEELAKLATLYQAGQKLWRVPLMHFTEPPDLNWPKDCKSSPCKKPPGGGDDGDDDDDCGKNNASTVLCQSQILTETVPVVGTPFSLSYASDRVLGRKNDYTRSIRLTEASVSSSLQKIELAVDVAGRRETQIFVCPNDCTANKFVAYTWDGKDAFGRLLQGRQRAVFTVTYFYEAVYVEPASGSTSFGQTGKAPLTIPSLTPLELSTATESFIGPWDALPEGLGAWTLDMHHRYDPIGKRLYLGTGQRRTTSTLPSVVRTVGGGGGCCDIHEGGKAIGAYFDVPKGLEIGPDGSVYFAEFGGDRVRKIDKSGIVTTIAGTGVDGYSGDA
jgi:hypothetical protein